MFQLHITITRASVNALKAELTKTLAEVKSSHRCEALARAFDFKTYASMRSATADDADAGIRRADGRAFAAYLTSHGFEVDTSILQLAVGRIALGEVLVRETELNGEGIGAGDRRKVDGIWETAEDRTARVERSRAGFTSDHGVREFLHALAYVSKIAVIKVNNRRAGSYDLKHFAERASSTFPEGQPLGPLYVSNGALIAAAIHSGFMHRRVVDGAGKPGLNATFNMSSASIAERQRERAA